MVPAARHPLRARDLADAWHLEPFASQRSARAAPLSPAHFGREHPRTFGGPPHQHLLPRRLECRTPADPCVRPGPGQGASLGGSSMGFERFHRRASASLLSGERDAYEPSRSHARGTALTAAGSVALRTFTTSEHAAHQLRCERRASALTIFRSKRSLTSRSSKLSIDSTTAWFTSHGVASGEDSSRRSCGQVRTSRRQGRRAARLLARRSHATVTLPAT